MKRSTAIMMLAVLIPAAQAVAGANDVDDLFRGGEVIVDHPPLDSGGGASDTAFSGGIVPWQRVADDILLAESALIHRVRFWGFYQTDSPPALETMRIRFYGARGADGLPDEDNILLEESFLNPLRTATGRTIFADVDAAEYLFQVDLGSVFSAEAGIPYWLEIVQVGDVDSHFRWEFSFTDQNDFAFVNDLEPDWTYLGGGADVAFQLIGVPEPSALGFVILGAALVGIKRSRREGRFR